VALSSGSVVNDWNGGGYSVVIDGSGTAWTANWNTGLSSYSNLGVALTAIPYGTDGLWQPDSIAVDGEGNVWVADEDGSGISEFSGAGVALCPSYGYSPGMMGAEGIAIDGSGNAWVANSGGGSSHMGSVTEMIGIGTPVITPVTAGLPATPTANGSSNLGTRP
jgi:secreted PhoX family phosphatase